MENLRRRISKFRKIIIFTTIITFAGTLLIQTNFNLIKNDNLSYHEKISTNSKLTEQWVAPRVLGTYSSIYEPNKILIKDNLAYIVTRDGGLIIINVTDPTQPQDIGTYKEGDNFFTSIHIDGNLAYLTGQTGPKGLIIVNVSNPTSPTKVSHFDIDLFMEGYGSGSRSWGVYVANQVAYVTFQSILVNINVSDPFNPEGQMFTNIGAIVTGSGEVILSENLVYVAHMDGLTIFSLGVEYLSTVGEYNLAEIGFSTEGLSISGNRAYLAGSGQGQIILDISNPSNPTVLGTFDENSESNDIAISDEIIYSADGTNGLEIIDISNPAQPTLKAKIGEGNAVGVDFANDIAYVVYNPLKKLSIIDPGYDFDDDGFSNNVETYLYHTDPSNKSDHPAEDSLATDNSNTGQTSTESSNSGSNTNTGDITNLLDENVVYALLGVILISVLFGLFFLRMKGKNKKIPPKEKVTQFKTPETQKTKIQTPSQTTLENQQSINPLIQQYGAPDYETALKIQQGGFPDYQNYQKAINEGFNQYKPYQQKEERKEKLLKLMKKAKSVGLDQFKAYMDFQDDKRFMEWLMELSDDSPLQLDGDKIIFQQEKLSDTTDDEMSFAIDKLIKSFDVDDKSSKI